MTVKVDLLSLGCGWTSQFLAPALREEGLSHAFTSSSNESPWIEHVAQHHYIFHFESEGWEDQATKLPPARLVLIIFPIKGAKSAEKLISRYESEHGSTKWLALGSTGIWKDGYHTSTSPIDAENARGQAEMHLLEIKKQDAAVLNLAGLYGRARKPVNFILKAASSLESLRQKNSLHLVHGDDVARAILSMLKQLDNGDIWGRRWIVTDTQKYDWWHLAAVVPGLPSEYAAWSKQLAKENDVTLPRQVTSGTASSKTLNRVLDGHEFWRAVGVDEKSLHGRFYELSERI